MKAPITCLSLAATVYCFAEEMSRSMTRLTTDNTIIRREIRKTVRSPNVRRPAHGGIFSPDRCCRKCDECGSTHG